jgi:uncharacterized membrane protein
VASLVVISAFVEIPEGARVALGVPIVFVLPGFVALSVAGRTVQLSWTESMLASLGISVAVATCVAMLLAAMPVGLSRSSFALVLGGSTMVGSTYALAKARLGPDKYEAE